jgi:creatinine amidohydrolase/Fe(II)-dependent formamide hydrolase-like protein
MAAKPPSRLVGDLTSEEIAATLRPDSVLCLPMGSMEQHGPHLPLNTDTVLAEAFTHRIVGHWAGTYDLWQLPPVTTGLSREHAWAPGTLSLSVTGMTALMRDLGREIMRAFPTKNLLVVNGHGGNRGILDALGRELRWEFGLNLGVLHLGSIMSPVAHAGVAEIHAGKDETSAMLVLAPQLVRRDQIGNAEGPTEGNVARQLILDPNVSFPWSSDDSRLARAGVIGDARGASVEHGEAIVARVLDVAGAVLARLLENRTAAR